MKKILFTAAFALAICFYGQDVTAQRQGPEKTKVLLADSTQQVGAYPMDVMTIITNKCLGCHSPSGRSDKAKEKLQWVQLQYMEPADLVAKLDEVQEVLEKGEMPPSRMLERFPNMKLTDDEVALLKEWAESTSTAAMGE
ncbi:MAG: heme-binding domain-containing protein [Bacteroidota bacterium]